MDIHVDFEKQSFCAIDDDNIYTYQYFALPKEQGAPPICDMYDTSKPITLNDSILVNECKGSPHTTTGTTPPPPTATTTAPPPPTSPPSLPPP
jgi:hypothetical protein